MKRKIIGRPRETMLEKPMGKQVLALRAKEMSFSQIGKKLKISKQRAQSIHARCLAEQSA